jgi:hypothetical protein
LHFRDLDNLLFVIQVKAGGTTTAPSSCIERGCFFYLFPV